MATIDILKPKKKMFVKHYLTWFCSTKAARLSGLKNGGLEDPLIAKAIDEGLDGALAQTKRQRVQVLRELELLSFSNMFDFVTVSKNSGGKRIEFRDDLDNIASAKLSAISEISENNTGIKLKLHDKLAALTLLAKYLGMYEEKHRIEMKTDDTGTAHRLMSDPVIAERIAELYRESKTDDS